MAVLHNLGNIADYFNKVGTEIARVWGGVADALNARDSADELEELAEGYVAFSEVFAITVDGLSKEGDFLCSKFSESPDFGDYVIGGARPFSSAGCWDDTETTEFVASILDGNIGFEFAGAFEISLGDAGNDFAFSFGKF